MRVHVDNLDDLGQPLDLLQNHKRIQIFVIIPLCRAFFVEMKESPQGTFNGKTIHSERDGKDITEGSWK